MTEEDLESTAITPEIMPTTQLSILINEGNLEPSKGKFLIEKFADHFKQAAEWAKKAKSIIVTDESQTVNMKMARTGRLFLREKRLEIENMRKLLKADALKECQVIDRICHFLKDVIIPTEEHLDRQEHFIEYREKAKAEAIKLEVEKRLAEEAEAKAKAEAEEREKLRIENERLRNEQEKIRKENERKIAEERAKRQAELDLVRKEQEEKLAKERAEREKVENELRLKKQAEMKAEAEKIKAAEALKKAGDIEKMQKFYNDLMAIEFPEVVSHEAKRVMFDSKSHVGLAVMMAKKYIQSTVTEEE